MKIGIDATFLPRDRRGMGQVVRNFIFGTAELNKKAAQDKRHELVFITFKPHLLDGLKEECGKLGLCCTVKDAPQDLDAVWYPWDRMDFSLPGAKVFTIHDIHGWQTERGRKSWRDWDRVCRDADKIAAISDFVKGEILHYLGDCPDGKLTVCRNGISSHFLERSADKALHSPAGKKDFLARFTDGNPFILFIGNPEEVNKNLAGMLEQLAPAVRGNYPHKILIVGSRPQFKIGFWKRLFPDDASRYINRVRELTEKNSDIIAYTGYLSKEAIVEAYSYCDAFAAVSKYEGFFLPMIEAMACSAPIFAAKAGVLPEVGGDIPYYYDPGKDGSMAEAFAQIVKAGGNPDDPDRTGRIKRGLERARQFSDLHQAENMLKIISEAAARHCGS